MLPLTLLNVSTGSPLLVELKGGDTYNGRLVSCDSWMNMNLRDVICTSKDGDRFWKLPSCYIRGSAVKYLRLPPELLEKAKVASAQEQQQHHHQSYHPRGGGSGRGRDGGGRGRGGRGRGGRGRGGRGGRDEGGRAGGGRGRSGGRGGEGRGRSSGGGRSSISSSQT
ncbi:LSM domain containing protein [Nitzschia inconspicua]|uniref:U6 snRNA-associated Sm-like protein LSm4 n=1 Tax=Nitzschia inconspicua TaxID=303405 RepID=A0A9K3LMZ5_9STRA|nr:LSM domain containing protein [Nitzschia inconspicua]